MRTAGRGLGTATVGSALLLALALAVPAGAEPDCPSRTMRISFYTCAEGFRHCLTNRGHQPIPFRTVAVGDRALLGRWIYIQDLGGWVHASDTGSSLRRDWLDVFIGDSRMAPFAVRLGIQHWTVQVCPSAVADVTATTPPEPMAPASEPSATRDDALARPPSGDRGRGGERQLEGEHGAVALAVAGRAQSAPVQPSDTERDGDPETAAVRGDPRR
jgi:3D (Asp-Asp-Asp) domain-containing protein